MANVNAYETVMVLSLKNGEEAVSALIEKFKKLIADNATVDGVDEWGKRRLAYPINDETEGFYTLINFTAEPDFISELSRVYNITDGVLRSMVIRKEQ